MSGHAIGRRALLVTVISATLLTSTAGAGFARLADKQAQRHSIINLVRQEARTVILVSIASNIQSNLAD